MNHEKYSPKKFNRDRELSLNDALSIIYRRKLIVIISVCIALLLVSFYNYLATPQYSASVLLKKEKIRENPYAEGFKLLHLMQTTDEVDTEMEIIKARKVLSDVISELKLHIIIDRVELQNGLLENINLPLIEYANEKSEFNEAYDLLALFTKIDSLVKNSLTQYYIEILKPDRVELRQTSTNALIKIINPVSDTLADSLKMKRLMIPNIITKIFFHKKHMNSAIRALYNQIFIRKVEGTDIFKVSIQSHSPLLAQKIANTLADKFREFRMDQKKQTVRYSFNFINNQLEEISEKLKSSEEALSQFKTENKIIIMDENFAQIIRLLSNLEAEKNKTEMELSEYEFKYQEIQSEVSDKQYFDQTYLSPGSGAEHISSPFSELLKQLSDAELNRIYLLRKRKENHPDIISLDERIKQIKQQLGNYNQNTITAYEIIVKSLKNKIKKLNQMISKYSKTVQKLPEQETKFAELAREKIVYEKMFNVLLDKREEFRIAELSKLQDILIIQSAYYPLNPISPRKSFNLMIGFIAGLIIGILGIFIQETLSKKLTNLDELEDDYSLPILAIFPKYNSPIRKRISNQNYPLDRKLVVLMEDQLQFKESYRLLRTEIINIFSRGKKVILISSCEQNSGKTTIVANLSVALAQLGKKVLAIDCDLKKSNLGEFFKVPKGTEGLISYLSNNSKTPTIYKPFKTNEIQINLSIINAGGRIENSGELLGTTKMHSLLTSLKSSYDYILIDTPPITKVVDVLVLGRYVKDILLIIRPNFTYSESISLALKQLTKFTIKLHGFIINACDIKHSSYYYRYGYGYGYADYEYKEVKEV